MYVCFILFLNRLAGGLSISLSSLHLPPPTLPKNQLLDLFIGSTIFCLSTNYFLLLSLLIHSFCFLLICFLLQFLRLGHLIFIFPYFYWYSTKYISCHNCFLIFLEILGFHLSCGHVSLVCYHCLWGCWFTHSLISYTNFEWNLTVILAQLLFFFFTLSEMCLPILLWRRGGWWMTFLASCP